MLLMITTFFSSWHTLQCMLHGCRLQKNFELEFISICGIGYWCIYTHFWKLEECAHNLWDMNYRKQTYMALKWTQEWIDTVNLHEAIHVTAQWLLPTHRQNETECTTNLILISQPVLVIHSKGTIGAHLRRTFTQSWRPTAAGDKWIRFSQTEVRTKHLGQPKPLSTSLFLSPFMVHRAAGLPNVTPEVYQVHYQLRQHAESQELRVMPRKKQTEKSLDFLLKPSVLLASNNVF